MMKASRIRRGTARLCLGVAKQLSRRDRDQAALRWVQRAVRVDEAWAEPWVAAGALHGALGHTGQALEAFIGANARDPQSRVIVLMLGMALDELDLCEEAYEWLVRAAHASGAADESVADGHPDSMFWRELGLYCVSHGRDDEAIQTAALAELYEGWSGESRCDGCAFVPRPAACAGGVFRATSAAGPPLPSRSCPDTALTARRRFPTSWLRHESDEHGSGTEVGDPPENRKELVLFAIAEPRADKQLLLGVAQDKLVEVKESLPRVARELGLDGPKALGDVGEFALC